MPGDREPERGKQFKALVTDAMRRQGITTQGELVEVTGIAKSTWDNWFQGSHPKRNTLRLAVEPLGLTLRQLEEPWRAALEVIQLTPDELEGLIARGAEKALANIGLTPQAESRPEDPAILREVADALEVRRQRAGRVQPPHLPAPPGQREEP